MDRPSGPSSTFSRRTLLTAAALGGSVGADRALAGVPVLGGTPTNIVGTAERLISYRHQSRMWATADGVIHLIANVGQRGLGPCLNLFSSSDGGMTWTERAGFADTDESSTSDSFLVNENLYVAYSTAGRTIMTAFLSYDAQSASWSRGRTETAFASGSVEATCPAFARDGNGRYWLAFTARDSTGISSIRMVRKTSPSPGWVDTGFAFGGADSASIERAGRPVAVYGGMGIVYTVQQDVYWARRGNDWSLDQPWARTLVYANLAPDTDPYGTHFNVLVDGASNVHVATMDGGRLLYLRLNHATQTWSRTVLTRPRHVAYMKLARSADRLLLIYNDRTQLNTLQSADGGLSWNMTHRLIHPPAGIGLDFGSPRVEALSSPAGSTLPVLQQYVELGRQGLLLYSVPVLTSLGSGSRANAARGL